MTAEEFSTIRSSIPTKPGVYRYLDKSGKLLYVGKAKNLRKRVSSYFVQKKYASARLKLLIRKIAKIETTVVNSERDALFLENSIIKAQQPKYNVALRDDKTYPYIVIKHEPFPRIFFTRKLINDGSEYYGPYTSVFQTREILKFIKKLYPIRTCNLSLTKENIEQGKYKVCLEYHIDNCLGPCVGKQSREDYDNNIEQIRDILKGNLGTIRTTMKEKMAAFSKELAFEQAHEMKVKLDYVDTFAHKSLVVNPKLKNIDVISIASDEKVAFANYMKVHKGSVVKVQTIELKKALEETDEELLVYALYDIQERGITLENEILVPTAIKLPEEEITITIPKIGDKKKLLLLSTKNAKIKLRDYQLKREQRQRKQKVNPVLLQMKEDLRLKELPLHIECFDNSNFQGDQPVASCVVFRNGKPFKSDYRRFNIKTVEGPDDFASMEEIVFRRYKRLLEEDEDLPQLIIIDGGKGQLNSALKSLQLLGIESKVTIIGIAKKLEEIYFPGDKYPVHINKRSPSLRIIQQLRNEAHRFAITFHRNKRIKSTLKTELTEIEGIGPKTAQKLLSHFRSIKKVKEANLSQLEQVINKRAAKRVNDYFTQQKPANK